MKPIVVPTDFSAPAENAMLYAGHLASTINASVLLLHVYQIPVGMNDVPVLLISADELKANAEAGLLRAKELLKTNFSSVEVKTESRLGSVVEELNDVCEKEQPLAVIAGSHGATGIERVLFGSTSLSIIRHSKYPVIVVPDTSQTRQLKKIALAIDNPEEPLPAKKIKTVVDTLKAQLQVIHVQQAKTGTEDLSSIVAELNSSCTTIRDNEFVHGIESYVEQNNIDLLMVLPHKHNLIERLFFRTHTPELVRNISIPIMTIQI
jgi:nucleotide-binding universal stress UspA family protein